MENTSSRDLNLTTHRSASSVWDRRGWDGGPEPVLTRWLIGIGGGALVVEGVRRRGVTGSLFAAVGSSLTFWAITGADLGNARRRVAGIYERAPWHSEDRVHEASADSFPASDAPAWTSVGAGVGARRRAT
jgi:hypothetical protein